MAMRTLISLQAGTMADSTFFRDLLLAEIDQRAQEGYAIDVDEWRHRALAMNGEDRAGLEGIFDDLSEVPVLDSYPFHEPDDLEQIHSSRLRSSKHIRADIPSQKVFDGIHGGWLGRCCGCSLGKPFDMDPYVDDPEKQQRKRVQQWLDGGASWPLHFYAPERSLAERIGLSIVSNGCTEDTIDCMQPDENINSMLVALRMLEESGCGFQTLNVAASWLRTYTYDQVPDPQVFRNIISDDRFVPRSRIHGGSEVVDWTAIAHRRNPWRESLTARSRADIYGYVAAGDPELAAEYAWRDARLSHVRNGIYGAMFVASLVAAAFVEKDPYRLIERGHGEIPSHSRLAVAIRTMVRLAKRHHDWTDCWDAMMEEFGSYPAWHAIPNTLICVLGLLYGEGDFEKSICTTVSCGLAAKSNGATVGSILGVMLGARKLPRKWTAPLQNTLKSGILQDSQTTISECARRSARLLESLSKSRR